MIYGMSDDKKLLVEAVKCLTRHLPELAGYELLEVKYQSDMQVDLILARQRDGASVEMELKYK